MGRPRADIRTRAGWSKGRDTNLRPLHLLRQDHHTSLKDLHTSLLGLIFSYTVKTCILFGSPLLDGLKIKLIHVNIYAVMP